MQEIVLSMCTMYLADPKDVTSNRKVTLQEVGTGAGYELID